LALAWTPVHALSVAAGALLVVLGAFVFKVQPRSPPHRFFLIFAVVDGLSTALFDLRDVFTDPATRVQIMYAYLLCAGVFVLLLLGFGLLFPRPIGGGRGRARVLAAIGTLIVLFVVTYVVDPRIYWTATVTGDRVRFTYGPWGDLVRTGFVWATAVVIAKLTWEILRDPAPTYRKQAAYILGGMALGYAPYATSNVVANLGAGRLLASLTQGGFMLLLLNWSLVVTTALLATAGILIAVDRRADRATERSFVLACIAGVAVLTAVALLFANLVEILLVVGLIAYPITLAYAIARYEVLDIEARVQRAAAVSIALGILGAAFLLLESFAQDWLETVFESDIGSAFVASLGAAIVTALLVLPVAAVARRVARRIAPELAPERVDDRRIEIYRHALVGVLADGIIDTAESRTLARLRDALGVTRADHERLVSEISGAEAPTA
jgi:hypothetical protein